MFAISNAFIKEGTNLLTKYKIWNCHVFIIYYINPANPI